jgi:cytochrome c peroxidase
MSRLDAMAWMFGRVIAASAALLVTIANAATLDPAVAAKDWTDEEKIVLASLSLRRLPPLPLDPSNAVEREPAAVTLGERLFNDPRLSRNGVVSCASCHDPKKQFQDGLAVSRGLGTGARRAMPIIGAAYSTWLFWDGRKDSMWAQALGPLEDAVEHGGNRTRYAQLVAQHYGKAYEALFKTSPKVDGLPADAGPNGSAAEQAAWAAMDARQREQVSRVFANIGKAIAAYEKSLQHEPSRLDHYVDGVLSADPAAKSMLDAGETRGLRLFIGKAQCVSCHNGPLFTDQQFHNTGVPPRSASSPDRGRAIGAAKVLGDEFNCLGPFSDARPGHCQELRFIVSDDPVLEGAFKTPSLRGVSQRPPYMHAGQLSTLEQVVRHYVAAPRAAVGQSELTAKSLGRRVSRHAERAPIEMTDSEMADLVSFLGALSTSQRPAAAAP